MKLMSVFSCQTIFSITFKSCAFRYERKGQHARVVGQQNRVNIRNVNDGSLRREEFDGRVDKYPTAALFQLLQSSRHAEVALEFVDQSAREKLIILPRPSERLPLVRPSVPNWANWRVSCWTQEAEEGNEWPS